MTFEVGEALNYMIDCFLKAPMIGTIAKNPIYTAIAITLMVIIIILIIFRDIEADETVLTMALRSGFWIFLMLLGIMMVHNRILMGENTMSAKDGLYEQVIQPSVGGRYDSEYVPIGANIQNNTQNNTQGTMGTQLAYGQFTNAPTMPKPILSGVNREY